MPSRSAGAHDAFVIKRAWLILLAFAIQLIAIPTLTDPSGLAAKKLVLAATGLMLLIGILPNLKWWGFRILAVGFLLNTLVMAANGGLMPVTPENQQRVSVSAAYELQEGQTPPRSKNVLPARSDTRLSFLSDVLYVYVSHPRPKVYSVGDALLLLGFVTLLGELGASIIRSRRPVLPSQRTGEAGTS